MFALSDTCDFYGKFFKSPYMIYVLYIFGKHETRQKRENKNILDVPFKKMQVCFISRKQLNLENL